MTDKPPNAEMRLAHINLHLEDIEVYLSLSVCNSRSYIESCFNQSNEPEYSHEQNDEDQYFESLKWFVNAKADLPRPIEVASEDGINKKCFNEINVSLYPAEDAEKSGTGYFYYSFDEDIRLVSNKPDRPSVILYIPKIPFEKIHNEIQKERSAQMQVGLRIPAKDYSHGPPSGLDVLHIKSEDCKVCLESLSISATASWINNNVNEDIGFGEDQVSFSDNGENDEFEHYASVKNHLALQIESINTVNKNLRALFSLGIWLLIAMIILTVRLLFK